MFGSWVALVERFVLESGHRRLVSFPEHQKLFKAKMNVAMAILVEAAEWCTACAKSDRMPLSCVSMIHKDGV